MYRKAPMCTKTVTRTSQSISLTSVYQFGKESGAIAGAGPREAPPGIKQSGAQRKKLIESEFQSPSDSICN